MTNLAPLRHVLAAQPVRRVSDWPVTPGIAGLWDCVHVDLQVPSEMTGDARLIARGCGRRRGWMIYPMGTVARDGVGDGGQTFRDM